jgi:hypothetical protein
MSSSIALGALVAWMLVLTVKHVIADFFLQTTWMAVGKDRATGWALPLLVHCAIHGALATLIIAAVQPKLWFLGLVDFVIHIAIDRSKGYLVNAFGVTQGNVWFWWLIGIDQALHHLTDFFLAIFIVANS